MTETKSPSSVGEILTFENQINDTTPHHTVPIHDHFSQLSGHKFGSKLKTLNLTNYLFIDKFGSYFSLITAVAAAAAVAAAILHYFGDQCCFPQPVRYSTISFSSFCSNLKNNCQNKKCEMRPIVYNWVLSRNRYGPSLCYVCVLFNET